MKITWEMAPQDAAKEKQQLSLASGDYHRCIFSVTWLDGISKVDAQKYGKEGVFLPLNDLIDENAPNIKKAMEEISYLKSGATAPDGIFMPYRQSMNVSTVQDTGKCGLILNGWRN